MIGRRRRRERELRAFAERIEGLCDVVIGRLAEGYRPPDSGTELDYERVRDAAREVLGKQPRVVKTPRPDRRWLG